MQSCSEPLDERKQIILKAVVHDYTSTAVPVSSEMLAYRYRLGVKSATIRNEMAEMVDLGYLRQPHTSAGRVPSDMGYRFYVDRLISGPGLSSTEEETVARSYGQATAEIESILDLTCRILSSLTQYASVATETLAEEVSVRHISLSALGPRKLLLALVVSDGRVEHTIIDLPSPVTDRKLQRLYRTLSGQFVGCRLGGLMSSGFDFEPPEAAGALEEYRILVKALRQLAREARSGQVHLDGAANVLSQPEFRDLKRMEALLAVLEQRKALAETVNAALASSETTIIIGSENAYSTMRDCSLVSAHYSIADRPCGAVGVIGPTRMNYRRAVAAVNLLARSLSELLTSISE